MTIRDLSLIDRYGRRQLLALLLASTVAACGGGGGRGDGANFINPGGSGNGGGSAWTEGVFLPEGNFQARCENPRSGNDPDGMPWPDVQGTVLDENNFLRSYSDRTYLWYDEITDRDPGLYSNPLTYFDLLKTDALTPSGNPKDQFHFTFDTDEWIALSESGVSGGYGAEFAILSPAPPRDIVIAFVNPGTPAADNSLQRGTRIVGIDGVDVENGNDIDTLNDGLFPATPGETHTFDVIFPDGSPATVTLQSALITSTPVLKTEVLPTPTGDVGYLLFNDHIATAEEQLVDAISTLDAANVSDLVLDLRYNGGGFLDIAAQLSFMIAGPAQTGGRVFELQEFNDKHPSTNPVTGRPLSPVPFHSTTLNFSLPAGANLPSLDLQRVYVLTGNGTCSASEAIINGLRGAGVEVIQIGSTTCGKPYGFYATDNCGTTYFTIQFRGVNDAGFGDYADGFIPSVSGTPTGSQVPGCPVGDDFGSPLGDIGEARLAAALEFRASGACPPAPVSDGTPALGRLRLPADRAVRVPKAPWRENRIMDRP